MYFFYVSYSSKQVIISDLAQDKIRKSYGNKIEIASFVKSKSDLDTIKPKILRNYNGFEIIELFQKQKYVMTPEHKQALINSKLGKKRSEEVKRKISETLKGKSNFQGKQHSYETKRIMAARKIGNQHNKNYIWAHDPNSDKEVMVKSRFNIPEGFSQGRDYYSTEPGLYEFKEFNKLRSSNS